MVSGAQQGYHPPQHSSSGGFPGGQYNQQQRQAYQQNAAALHHQPRQDGAGAAAGHAPFTGFKLGGATPPPQNAMRPGGHRPQRWTIEKLRASDAIIPLQSGTNQFASQRGMTGFGQPRLTKTPVFGGIDATNDDAIVPLQYGTNQFASQRGMTGFGAPRDVTGKHLHTLADDDIATDQGPSSDWQF